MAERTVNRKVRAGLAELDVGVVPEIESGVLDDADRTRRSGPGLDEREPVRYERIRLGEREVEGAARGRGRARVPPARDGLRRYRAQPVGRLEVR